MTTIRGGILLVALLLGASASSCGERGALDGTWQLDPARSRYAGTAEARREETFQCDAGADRVECSIVAVRIDGDTTRARFIVVPDGGAGEVRGVDGVDRVLLLTRENGYDAVFLDGTTPVLGYRITPFADSLVVRTTDPHTGDLLETRVVYTRER